MLTHKEVKDSLLEKITDIIQGDLTDGAKLALLVATMVNFAHDMEGLFSEGNSK